MACDHDVCRAVHRAFARTLELSYRRRAASAGIARGSSGAVTCIQRFGSALNLNVHFHTQALDGVFRESQDGRLAFFPLAAPTSEQVRDVLEDLICRLQPILRRFGLHAEDEHEGDPLALQSEALAAMYTGSVLGHAALGPRANRAPAAVGRDPHARWHDRPLRHHAQLDGFDLHASVSVPASARDRLEQLLRYCARPAISHDRLELLSDGRVQLELKAPRFDGTTHLVLTAHELIERLVAVIPRPQKNLFLYTGVLAPRSRLRSRVCAYGRDDSSTPATPSPCPRSANGPAHPASPSGTARGPSRGSWARLMQRAFDIDVLECPGCRGRMRLLALIEKPSAARRILRHLGMRDHPPPMTPARFDDDEHAA